jgi:hypothetical protein
MWWGVAKEIAERRLQSDKVKFAYAIEERSFVGSSCKIFKVHFIQYNCLCGCQDLAFLLDVHHEEKTYPS